MVQQGSYFPKENPKSPLGTDRKIGVTVPTVPPAPENETPNEYRFRLQKWARSCYGNFDHRLNGCCIRTVPGGWGVDIVRNPETNSAHFVGLEQCSRVWTCPVCAQRITNQRRKELSAALAAAKLRGWTPVLVTYTLQHRSSDLLAHTMDALQRSLRDFKSGKAWQTIKHEYGVQGGIKALEVTYGENGWHPHVHELMFLDVPKDRLNVPALQNWLADRWLAMLARHGMSASYVHGLDVRTADSAIADYIAKWGKEPREQSWGAEHEIARAPNKKGHRDGLTPFQLLECVSGGDAKARVLFQEYARCMEGKRQLVWSPGLRDQLQLPDELLDEQLPLFDESPAAYVAVEISREEWKRCCIYELQPLLLELAGQGDLVTLRAVLKIKEIQAELHEQPPDDYEAQSVDAAQITQPAAGSQIYAQTTLFRVSDEVYS